MRKYISRFVFLPVFLVACASTPQQKQLPHASSEAQQLLERAKLRARNKNSNEALSLTALISKKFPETQTALEAQLLTGDIYNFQKQDAIKATHAYRLVLQSKAFSPTVATAAIRLADLYEKQRQLLPAHGLLQQYFEFFKSSPQESYEIVKRKAPLERLLMKRLDLVSSLSFLADNSPSPSEKQAALSEMRSLVETQLSAQEAQELLNHGAPNSLKNTLYYRAAMTAAQSGDMGAAKKYFMEVQSQDPELYEKAQIALDQIAARSRTDSKTIGVILPLSGRHSKIGYRVLAGIQMALGISGSLPNTGLRLSIIDSEGLASRASQAMDKLVVEDQVIGVIGGLLSKEAQAITQKAHELGVPTILLSQKAGLTAQSPWVFRNAITSEMLTRYLVDVAMTQMHWKKFAILYPNDAYGVEYANLFWDEVLARGGQITAAQPYDSAETDFRQPIQKIVDTFYVDDRLAEYKLRLDDFRKKNPSSRKGPPKDLLPPFVNFDAIFIPDQVKALGQIASMLAYNDIFNIPLLGTNLWNTSELTVRGGKYIEGSLFVDAGIDPLYKTSSLFRDFPTLWGSDPELFEIQAYDAGLLVKTSLDRGGGSREAFRNQLASTQNLSGGNGPIFMTRDRELLRSLKIYTVKEQQIQALQF